MHRLFQRLEKSSGKKSWCLTFDPKLPRMLYPPLLSSLCFFGMWKMDH